VAFLVLGACRDRPAAETPPRTVAARSPVVALEDLLRGEELRGVETWRISGEAEQLTDVGVLLVGANDEVIFGPGTAATELRVFASDGRRTRVIGRKGSGPGEFRYATSAGWCRDTIWVWDYTLRRLSRTMADGRRIDERTIIGLKKVGESGVPIEAQNLHIEAATCGSEYLATLGSPNIGASRDSMVKRQVVAIDDHGVVQRVLGNFPVRHPTRSLVYAEPIVQYLVDVPFSGRPLLDFADDGSRVAYVTTAFDEKETGTIRVLVLTSVGDTVVDRGYRFRGVPISTRVRDSAIAIRVDNFRRDPYRRNKQFAEQLAAEGPSLVPPAYPPVSHMVVGLDTTIWLGLRTVSPEQTWLVLDAAGNRSMVVRLPASAEVRAARRSAVWAVVKDDDGVPSVVRYDLVKGDSR
jgi:hypothetical protein